MSDPLFEIAMAAADIKAAAPQLFERLIEAFKKYEERCRIDFYAANEASLVGAQARAQTAQIILTKLETCYQIRSQFERKRT
jgi:hypothetical protein